ncbi:phosphatidylethanolamine-binding protein homolog F40A3.3 isoform X5 [Microplitis demolitor]|nr:phosphatidylethanolamine-binding protein homolog F40A3.3 isoform X5 [Microplitis demolitor]XP_008554052.1 phosphatidylethanolamine-binding protein homolog F40A3.3 isoform X5 [Microplitis demolitor]
MSTQAFKIHEVVPDVIDKPPAAVLQVNYANNVKVELGNELTPTKVKDPPTVNWDADSGSFYTLCMTDPDVPSRSNPSVPAFFHWIVVNIPAGNIEKGQVIISYIGPGPPKDSGLHRYILLLYKQPGKLSFDDERLVPNTEANGRTGHSVKSFADKYKFGDPIAGNFYEASYDEYVPILHKQLGII